MCKLFAIFTTVDYRVDLLPFWFRYYKGLGAERVFIGLWNGYSNPVWPRLLELILESKMDVQVYPSVICHRDAYCGMKETACVNYFRCAFVPPGQWYAIADVDEFCWFNGVGFEEMIGKAEARNCHAVAGDFLDRISGDGTFPPIPGIGERTLDETFPKACDLPRHMGCGTAKVPLARQDVEIIPGHHSTTNHPRLEYSVEVHHFKWHRGVLEMLEHRSKAFTAQQLPHAPESGRYLEFFKNPNWPATPELHLRDAVKIGI